MKRLAKQESSTTEVKEYLMSLIGSAPYGIFAIDLHGMITIANTLAVEYLGVDESVAKVIDCPVLSLTSEMPEFSETLRRCLEQGRASFDLESLSAGDRFLTIKGRLILNGMLITLEDVTKHIRAGQELRLQAEKLARSNKELEEFAYISSHDMKSPIASLDGIIKLMQKQDAVKKEHAHLLEMAVSSTGQMRRTITALNDIIAFRKTLNAGRKKIKFAEVLEEVKTAIAEQIISSKAVIRADFSKCSSIEYPLIHLRSILQNLVTNAIKYAQPGKPPQITITTGREKGCIVLQVSDKGLGIDMKRHGDKLYGLFQRFHTHAEGMGIGLHIVQSIVESYGGKIQVDSEVGRGTTFKIFLTHGDAT